MKLGVMGAMQEEVLEILQHMEDISSSEKAGITFYEGTLYGVPVTVCKSGVGKVNAAMCTQILTDQFRVTDLVFTGVAGAIHPQLGIGDLVISDDAQHHDLDATALGFERGEIPFAGRSVFTADERLIKLAFEVSEVLFPGRVFRGRVLSGDQFIADRDAVRQLRSAFGGWCTEMEGAAMAQVCDANGVPFVIIRSMSDKADGSAHVNFQEFVQVVANHSAAIVQGMCKQLAASQLNI